MACMSKIDQDSIGRDNREEFNKDSIKTLAAQGEYKENYLWKILN
jgi:hypothetical protein